MRTLEATPQKLESAKVISKATKIGGSGAYISTKYFVTFEISNGNRKIFQSNLEQFNGVTENETGTLTYKEHENDLMFIDFKSDS